MNINKDNHLEFFNECGNKYCGMEIIQTIRKRILQHYICMPLTIKIHFSTISRNTKDVISDKTSVINYMDCL